MTVWPVSRGHMAAKPQQFSQPQQFSEGAGVDAPLDTTCAGHCVLLSALCNCGTALHGLFGQGEQVLTSLADLGRALSLRGE